MITCHIMPTHTQTRYQNQIQSLQQCTTATKTMVDLMQIVVTLSLPFVCRFLGLVCLLRFSKVIQGTTHSFNVMLQCAQNGQLPSDFRQYRLSFWAAHPRLPFVCRFMGLVCDTLDAHRCSKSSKMAPMTISLVVCRGRGRILDVGGSSIMFPECKSAASLCFL